MPKSHQNVGLSFDGESLTHFGGLYLLQQFFQQIALRSHLAQSVRFRQRNTHYTISDSILAILYPILLGLGRIETTRLLQQNGVFQYLTGLPSYPDPTSLRRFLRRLGEQGLPALARLHDRLRTDFIARPSLVIFDIDTTVLTVYGSQDGAKVGFNPKKRGRPSYQPLLCFEGKTRDVWSGCYLSGDAHPAPHTVELLERSLEKLPSSVRTVRLRADSAFYTHEIPAFLAEKRAFYVLVGRITRPVRNRLKGLAYQDISPRLSLAEFAYQPWGWKHPQRFIVVRRPIPEEPSWQMSLFKMGGYTYRLFVTNLSLKPLHLWRFYNRRATGELIIRELVEAYALGKIPRRDWPSNHAYFHLVLLAYNLLNWFKRFCLPPQWQRLNLQTIRNRLLLVPAQLVRPQGRPTLKLPASFPYEKVYRQTLANIRRLKRQRKRAPNKGH